MPLQISLLQPLQILRAPQQARLETQSKALFPLFSSQKNFYSTRHIKSLDMHRALNIIEKIISTLTGRS